jgi:hypothetical protein
MSDYIDDPELLAQLNAPASKDEYVSDPALLAQLNGPTGPEPGGAAPQFYPTGAGVSTTGAVQTAGKIVGPAASAVGNVAKTYLTNPVAALTDLTMGHFGLPPPVASTQIAPGVQESYQQVKDYLNKSGQFTPKPAPSAEMANAARINQAIGPEGLAAAMKPGAAMPTQVPVAGGPAAQEGATFIARMAQKFAPMARAVAPVLNTAGRIAGPAGLAYNAYEAANYAQQAELGNRLAQGEGKLAQTAFRNMNTQYGAPITREQAITVLQSNNPRDIQAFGGIEKLRAIAGL